MPKELKLFDYQKVGAEKLSKTPFMLLADDMGLGKTAQTIHGADLANYTKVLIICPSIAKVNWLREFDMWSKKPRSFCLPGKLSETPRTEQSVICSFDYASHNFDILKNLQFDVMIVDEAHFLKNPTAKRTKNLLGKYGIIHSVSACWFLTGTPAPNNASELWVMLYTLKQTTLTYEAFVRRYCAVRNTTYGTKIDGTCIERIPELKKLMNPIMLRRKKEDVLDLPPIHFGDVYCEPGTVIMEDQSSFVQYFYPNDRRAELIENLKAQTRMTKSVFLNLKDNEEEPLYAAMSIYKSVSELRRYIGLQKVKPTVDMVRAELEANAYKKIVIFCVHRDVIFGLQTMLSEFKPVTLYGGTPQEKRMRKVDRFQFREDCRVFIGQVVSAGTAITLTAANHVLFVEQDWTPGNNAQAIMRCHRVGQRNNVYVRFLSIDKSLDQKIARVVRRKTEELTKMFD